MSEDDDTDADEIAREERLYIDSLRAHGRIVEAAREDVPLPPGVTHVLVTPSPGAKPRLVERRKSAF
jgi:hypothetical protein